MKILFDNAATRATISSTNENANYPASNLIDEFLRIRWQEYHTGSVITIEFDDPEDIDCVFWAYSNAENIVVFTDTGAGASEGAYGIELTSSGDYLTTSDGYMVGIVPASDGASAVYFDSVQTGVTHLYIWIYGEADKTYLGGIGCGLSTTLYPVVDYKEGYEDNSIIASSPYGQVAQNYIDPLVVDSYNFVGVTRETLIDIRDKYKTVGVGGKVWVDLTSEKHEFKTPMYAVISAPFQSAPMGNGKYSFSLSFTEAR